MYSIIKHVIILHFLTINDMTLIKLSKTFSWDVAHRTLNRAAVIRHVMWAIFFSICSSKVKDSAVLD